MIADEQVTRRGRVGSAAPTTQARIGLGRAGNALPTQRVLEFKAAHAAARDAVHDPLDIDGFSSAIEALGIGAPMHVRSCAETAANTSDGPTWAAPRQT